MENNEEKKIPICKDVLVAWKEVNADDYSKFKDMMDTILSDMNRNTLEVIEKDNMDGDDGLGEEKIDNIENFKKVLVLLAKGESTIEDWYTEALKNRSVLAFCICCYICVDNGLGKIKKGIEKKVRQFENIDITESVKNFFKEKADDKELGIAEPSDKKLNLLTLRRWHYEHPQMYADFLESVNKAYYGDMTFANKGVNYLMEMLSFGGIKKTIKLILQLISGKGSFRKQIKSSKSLSFHDELTNILNTDLDNEVTRQKILQNDPHFNSTLYWLAFDDGFLKAVDLMSKTFLEENNPEIIKNLGRNVIKSLILTSFGKAAYTKKQWKNMEIGNTKELVASTLMDLKGRRGRRNDCLLLEEMIKAANTDPIIEEIDNTVSEWKKYDDTDSILAYIFAALHECGLLNGKYAYRVFHSAMLEKFPQHSIKQGYDYAEALFHALTNEGDYNTNISAEQIDSGRKHVENIRLRFRIILSPDIKQ